MYIYHTSNTVEKSRDCIVLLFLHVGYLICIAPHGDLANNHHISSTLDAETFGLVFRSNQVS